MSGTELQRFFGLPASAGDQDVLGLPDETLTAAAIDAAAHARLDQIRRHPGAGGPDAAAAESRVRLAAARLRGRVVAGAASPAASTRASSAAPASPPTPAPPIPPRPRFTQPPLELAPDEPVDELAGDPFRDQESTSVLDRRRVEASEVGGRSMGDAFRGVRQRRPSPDELPPLTPFDRAALGTLVGHGGWNRRSRARLVSLASAHGVGARGLLNVITGLADYSRAGSRPAPLIEIADDFTRYTLREVLVTAPAAPDVVNEKRPDGASEFARALMPELKEAGPLDTVKLVAAVLLPLILLIVVIGRGFTRTSEDAPTIGVGEQAAELAGDSGRESAAADRPRRVVNALVFERIPWMQGPPPGPGLLTAADELPRLPGLIEADVVRRLGVRTPPSDATVQRWGVSMAEAERGWVRARPSDVRDTREMSVTALNATADRAQLASRFASFLRPPTELAPPEMNETPFAWAGAWRLSVLAAVMLDPFAPDPVRQVASDIVRESLAPLGTGQTAAGFASDVTGTRAITAAWLELAAQDLIDAGDDIGPEPWERWLDAVEALDGDLTVGTTRDRLIAAALERLLRSSRPISEAGLASDLLGRLVLEIPTEMPLAARQTIEAAFVDRQIATDDDLRALSTILALRRDLPWFGDELVLPASATAVTRSEYRVRVAAVWPTPPAQDLGGQPIPVDVESLEVWSEAVAEVRGRAPSFDDAIRLGRLAEVSRLIESAAMLARNRLDESSRVSEDLIALPPILERPIERPLSSLTEEAIGEPDGSFTTEWDRVRNRGNDAMILLRGLSTRIGSDLGPRDAATFADIMLRPGRSRQREMTRLMFADQLRGGFNVVLAVADRIPTSSVDPDLASTVNRVVASEIVFEREAQWRLDARLALLRHASDLLVPREDVLSTNLTSYTESLSRRIALVRDEATVDFSAADPGAAIGRLADAWLRAASVRVSVRPVPTPARMLPERRATRRSLAVTRLQSTAADLIAVLESLAFVAAAEQPRRSEDVAAALERCQVTRRETANVLNQLMAIELGIVELWEIRFGLGGEMPSASDPFAGTASPPNEPADPGPPSRDSGRGRGVESPITRPGPGGPGPPDALPDRRNPGSRPRRAPGIAPPVGAP